MIRITNWVDVIALIIQIVGTMLMAINAPKNKPMGTFAGLGVDYKTPLKRENYIRMGLIVLCVGFILQLVSLIIKLTI